MMRDSRQHDAAQGYSRPTLRAVGDGADMERLRPMLILQRLMARDDDDDIEVTRQLPQRFRHVAMPLIIIIDAITASAIKMPDARPPRMI